MSEWDEDDAWVGVPSDIEAERWVLGAMITNPRAVDAAVDILAPEHFYRPGHRVIYQALVMMFAAQEKIDPVTLRAWIQEDGDSKAIGGDRGGEYIMGLYGLPTHPGGVPHYAGLVLSCAIKRAMAEEGQRLVAAARSLDGDPAKVMAETADRIAAVASATARKRVQVLSLTEFMSSPALYVEPVIPGLLDHQDRVIVVGGEGAGKTTLGHQVGFCAAAGVHPFQTGQGIPPQRVMVMDMENPHRLLQKRFGRLIAIAEAYRDWDPERLKLWVEPGGIDLGNPQEAFRAAEAVRLFRPDLLIAGPLYKMMVVTGENPEIAHGRVARWFDQMRSLYGCAVWIEHHAPLGGQRREMRPMGSGIWSRWPEFGISLVPATKAHGGADGLEFSQFRGHRDEGRVWPSWITRNRMGGWPWVPNFDREVFNAALPMEET